jgi:hypothetical protein
MASSPFQGISPLQSYSAALSATCAVTFASPSSERSGTGKE